LVLLIFVLIVGICALETKLGYYITLVKWSIWVAVGVIGLVLLLLIVAKKILKYQPLGWIVFVLFMLAIAFIYGYTIAHFGSGLITKYILLITGVITVIIFIFWITSILTGGDVSMFVGILLILIMGSTVFFVAWLAFSDTFIDSLLMSVSVAAYSFFIICDINMIKDPEKLRYNLGRSDWMLGAVHVFLDFFILPFILFSFCKNGPQEEEDG